MTYQTLYRKYRPKNFDLVFGQDTIVKTLKNVISNNKLSHAYLFTGPRGTGKTSCAKLFAKTVNCLNNNNGNACDNCENCKSFNKNNNPDVIEIDAASNNGVDEIREIKSKVNLVPSMSKYKVYIIDEVHMLSIGAFNALLKTLEEPPSYIIFILATTEPQKIPETIISRCQRFDFKSISNDSMKKCLNNIIEKENILIEEEALDAIVEDSRGGMRDAIGILDQMVAFCDKKIISEDVDKITGNISDEKTLFFIEKIVNMDYKNVIECINDFNNEGKDYDIIVQKMLFFIKKGVLYRKIKEDYKDLNDEMKSFFNKISDSLLYFMFDYVNNIACELQNTKQKKIFFEIKIIQLIDKLNNNFFDNEQKKEKNKKNVNVSRETLTVEQNELEGKIEELKNIRINNILLKSSKEELNFIEKLWKNINDYLIDDNYKMSAGLLISGKPVAASKSGIIITLPNNSNVQRIEQNYDVSKEIINKIYNNTYKIVYITDSYWKKIRPFYVDLVKNKKIEKKDEEYLLSQILKLKENKNEILYDFDELIVMED